MSNKSSIKNQFKQRNNTVKFLNSNGYFNVILDSNLLILWYAVGHGH